MIRYIDTHCHLDFPEFDGDRDKVVERLSGEGVEAVVNVGVSTVSSRRCVELAARHRQLFASVGIHPHDTKHEELSAMREIEALAGERKVVSVGETGLDYHYDEADKGRQRDFFVAHIALAKRLNLPLIVHQRDSREDMLDILESVPLPERLVFHCFGSDPVVERFCRDKGFYVSFTGTITYRNSGPVREVAARFPEDRVMAETDSPYLAPAAAGRRGRNEPGRVRFVVEEIVRARREEPEAGAGRLFRNAVCFFRLDKHGFRCGPGRIARTEGKETP